VGGSGAWGSGAGGAWAAVDGRTTVCCLVSGPQAASTASNNNAGIIRSLAKPLTCPIRASPPLPSLGGSCRLRAAAKGGTTGILDPASQRVNPKTEGLSVKVFSGKGLHEWETALAACRPPRRPWLGSRMGSSDSLQRSRGLTASLR